MLLVSETVLMCTVAFLKAVGELDISFSFVAFGSHCDFINTGSLTVSLHGAASLHSAVTLRVDWLGCNTLAEKPPPRLPSIRCMQQEHNKAFIQLHQEHEGHHSGAQ